MLIFREEKSTVPSAEECPKKHGRLREDNKTKQEKVTILKVKLKSRKGRKTSEDDGKARVTAILSVIFGKEIPVWACEQLISLDRIFI